ncbi:CBS domain-containing protein [Planococcus shenhongbingii]|uniref:CBS domain-containing protein n=1 Tax=Planococcus shenhongbingii TaxID=3058398 RepID=A0ABT8NAZ5_9BACL|nr:MULTISPECIES: CBS domain-containing protein [unclassified Planococcus (in: firmicutes)]MDN7245066.1 CBS domain-containing protein [Planococcus sp. N017]WKA58161.1 CBS domain-containing protein [Planococcus sp. N016]
MKVTEIMTSNVDTCSTQTSLQEIAAKMKDLDVGSIPIVDNDKLVGIITDRDIVTRGIAEQKSLDSPVSDILSSNPVTASTDMDVEDAANLMAQHQIRRLPVVEGDKIVGIVSLGDIAVKDKSYDNAEIALDDVSEPAEPER